MSGASRPQWAAGLYAASKVVLFPLPDYFTFLLAEASTCMPAVKYLGPIILQMAQQCHSDHLS